jgi:hypothetical protein
LASLVLIPGVWRAKDLQSRGGPTLETPNGYYNVERMLHGLLAKGAAFSGAKSSKPMIPQR